VDFLQSKSEMKGMRKEKKIQPKADRPLDVKEKVLKALEEVRPYISSHGGGVELVSVKGGRAIIKISGACVSCPMASATFGAGMEELIKRKVPEVKEIEFRM